MVEILLGHENSKLSVWCSSIYGDIEKIKDLVE